MSRNLTDLLRAREREGRPTALAALKEAMDQRGEITDEDRRAGGRAVRPPRGDRLRHLHLLRRPHPAARAAPRVGLHRHGLLGVATSAATWRRWASGSASRPASAPTTARSRSARRSASASATRAAAVRDGDVVDAGPGAVDRVAAGACARRPPSPTGGSVLDEPVLLARGTLRGPPPRAREPDARGAARRGEGGQRARPRRRRLPGRHEVGVRRARRATPTG